MQDLLDAGLEGGLLRGGARVAGDVAVGVGGGEEGRGEAAFGVGAEGGGEGDWGGWLGLVGGLGCWGW